MFHLARRLRPLLHCFFFNKWSAKIVRPGHGGSTLFRPPRSFPANDEEAANRDSIGRPRLAEPAHQRFQEPAKSSPEFGPVTKTTGLS